MARGKPRSRKARKSDKPKRPTAAAERRGSHIIDVLIDAGPSYKQRPVKMKRSFTSGVPGTGKAAASRARRK